MQSVLLPLGFSVERPVFSQAGTPDVENLYARLGTGGPNLMFAGHTDVVPAGDEASWSLAPFEGRVKDGHLYGRGAVDMKGGIACFVAATARAIARHGTLPGSLSFLVTGDEEGPSINGTDKLLSWAKARGEHWDGAVVGEPSNPQFVGETIKNGRRGSLSGRIIVDGIQGHAAYPQLADNPVTAMLDLLAGLIASPFDSGTAQFQPTNLEVTSVDVGNAATNVIAAQAKAVFNIRFNDLWDEDTIKAEITGRLESGAADPRLRRGRADPVRFRVEWLGRVSPVFLTRDEKLIETLSQAIESVTGHKPGMSTSGGTSDARFIKDYCPVVEFGLVGQTMHQIDERVALADLETLTSIYLRFIERWFGLKGQ